VEKQTSTDETPQGVAEVVVPDSAEPTVTADAARNADVVPEEAPAKDKASRARKAPQGDNGGEPREGSKTSQVIATGSGVSADCA
jgi:hypothetical protein